MGHTHNNTLQDILCRFERMRGRDVLWQPGTDHAGIATQMLVERQLAERQQHRQELGREEFVRRVWAWKEESGGAIVHQLKRLGAWNRQRSILTDAYRQSLASLCPEVTVPFAGWSRTACHLLPILLPGRADPLPAVERLVVAVARAPVPEHRPRLVDLSHPAVGEGQLGGAGSGLAVRVEAAGQGPVGLPDLVMRR